MSAVRMTPEGEDRRALELLDSRLRTVLPEEYQVSYDEVQPVSMGSAGLKFAHDGTVAWDQMWATFCDLAMAGGPPHKGTLLEPASRIEVEAQPNRYRRVVDEICRGVTLVTGLPAQRSPLSGWVRVACASEVMADWLVRAIVMENVSARREANVINLPAGPEFRLEKEIKNVITVIAKTCHYWLGHMPHAQQREIARLFATLTAASPLIEPALASDGFSADEHQRVSVIMGNAIGRDSGLRRSPHHVVGWLGVECPSARTAIWMMRALVVSNILARREGIVLFVPVNPMRDADGTAVSASVVRMYRLAVAAQSA